MSSSRMTAIAEPTNGAAETVAASRPYTVDVTIRGVASILFHAWNVDAVAAKASAAKGSKSKKSDDVETYVHRDEKRQICLPGEYLRQSIITAAKFRQDPRSPRKIAADLFKAAVVTLTDLASLGTDRWDFEDRRRVMIQRAGVTRVRPAMREGWRATVRLLVLLPEYVSQDLLAEVLTDAGRLIGVGDFRPTFGRFRVERFQEFEG